MNISYLSPSITLTLIIVGLFTLKKLDILDDIHIAISIMILSSIAGILFYLIPKDIHDNSLKAPMIMISNCIENSMDENDIAIEKEIEMILNKTLGNKIRNTNISSYTNKKSQIRLVKVNVSVGKNFYLNYEYEYVVNLKTKKIKECNNIV